MLLKTEIEKIYLDTIIYKKILLIQHLGHPHWNTNNNVADEPSTVISERCHRARINSAIFVSSEGRGFDSIEFIRRYGSQSVLCRKAKSAENIPAGNRNVSK